MRCYSLFVLFFMVKLLSAQTEMELAAFDRILVSGAVKVELVQGPKAFISSVSPLKNYAITVQNGELKINLANPNLKYLDPLVLHFVQINTISLNQSGQVSSVIGSSLNFDSLVIKAVDASKVAISITMKVLDLSAKDAAKITLNGQTQLAKVNIKDAAKLYAANFKINQLQISAHDVAYFNVNVAEGIDISATDVARGIFVGSPSNKKFNVNGLASIVDANTGEKMHDERDGLNDTTRFAVGKKKLLIIEEGNELELSPESDSLEKAKELYDTKKYKLRKAYSGIEFGFNQFVSPSLAAIPNDYAYLKCNMLKSWFISYNLLEGDVHLVRNKLALSSGLGIMFQNMRFNTNRLLIPNINVIAADSGKVSLSMNNLFNTQFNVPILLKYAPRTKNNKGKFTMALGVIGTFNIYTHLRVVSSAKGYTEDLQIKDNFNMNPFGAMGTLRMSYGWLHTFANYSLTPYFKTQNNNPDLRLFSIGIAILPRG